MISGPFADLFDGAERQSADELPLGEPSEYDDRGNGERRCRRQLRPEQALGTRIGCDEHRERRGIQRRKVQRPERLVPRQDEIEQQRRGEAGNGHRRQHIDELASDGRAIHPRRFEDILRDFLEIGEEHPDHDRQIAETQDQDQTGARIEQAEIPVDQIDRNQHADRTASSWSRASRAGRPWSAWSARTPSTRRPERR